MLGAGWVRRSQRILKLTNKSNSRVLLDRLNDFLKREEPESVFWLTRFWNDQQQAVTYKELREAILNGMLDETLLYAWQLDYARFVTDKLNPLWLDAMRVGAARLAAEHPGFQFNPASQGVQDWIERHGAQWVTNVRDEQRKAIAAMISRASTGAWTADELSRAIRPVIGLTKPQAIANLNYYTHIKLTLLQNNPGMRDTTAARRAREAAMKYAARQQRERAHTIATTELAFAYNKGADEAVKQAIAQGYMGRVVRIWRTSHDDRVCPVCASLDGTRIGMEEGFSFGGRTLYDGHNQTPPAHPRCGCCVDYEEIEPPTRGNDVDHLQWYREPDIMGMASGAAGDSDGYTTITEVTAFDYSDPSTVKLELAKFAAKHQSSSREYAMVLSPRMQAFYLTGESRTVNTRLVGLDAIKCGSVIHNHPVVDGYADAFSLEDFRELFWGLPAESWLISGKVLYRMSYTGPPISPAEAVDLYKAAFRRVREQAAKTRIPIELEQLQIMRELARTMKGLSFNEFPI